MIIKVRPNNAVNTLTSKPLVMTLAVRGIAGAPGTPQDNVQFLPESTTGYSSAPFEHKEAKTYVCDVSQESIHITIAHDVSAEMTIVDSEGNLSVDRRVELTFTDAQNAIANKLFITVPNTTVHVYKKPTGEWVYRTEGDGQIHEIGAVTDAMALSLGDKPVGDNEIVHAINECADGATIYVKPGYNYIDEKFTIPNDKGFNLVSAGAWSVIGYEGGFNAANDDVFSQPETDNVQSYSFINIGFYGGKYGLVMKSAKRLHWTCWGRAANRYNGASLARINYRNPQTDTWANGGILGYNSSQADLQAWWASSETSNGGCCRLERIPNLRISGECYGNLRGFRISDCGEDAGGNGSVSLNLHAHDNAEAGVYLSSTTYSASAGCRNTTAIGISEFCGNNGLLLIGSFKFDTTQFKIFATWSAGLQSWSSSETTYDPSNISDCNRSPYTAIGTLGDAKASVAVEGPAMHPDAKFIIKINGGVIKDTGLGRVNEKVAIYLGSSLNYITTGNAKVILGGDLYVDNQDVVIVNDSNLDIVELTLGGIILGKNNGQIVRNNGTGNWHSSPKKNVYSSVNTLNLTKDDTDQTVFVSEYISGFLLDSYNVNTLLCVAVGSDKVKFEVVGSNMDVIDDVPVGGCYINGSQVEGSQSDVVVAMNNMLSNSGGGGGGSPTADRKWAFDDTSTIGNPGAGKVALQGTTLSISAESTNGQTYNLLPQMVANNTFYLMQVGEDDRFLSATVVSVTNNTSWFEVEFTEDSTGNPFVDEAELLFQANTPGSFLLPSAANTPNWFNWGSNTAHTAGNLGGTSELYYGVALKRDKQISVTNYYEAINNTSGWWVMGLRDMSISPSFDWLKRCRFNPAQIFSNTTLADWSEGFDTVNGQSIGNTNPSELVLKWSSVDNKLRWFSKQGPLNILLTESQTDSGTESNVNEVLLSLEGFNEDTSCPVPDISIRDNKAQGWYAIADDAFDSNFLIGPGSGGKYWIDEIPPGYSLTWQNNVVVNNRAPIFYHSESGQEVLSFQVFNNKIQNGIGFAWEFSLDYPISNNWWIEYELSANDNKVRIWLHDPASNNKRVLFGTSVASYSAHRLNVRADNTSTPTPIIYPQIAGKFETVHVKSLLQDRRTDNGLVQNQVITMKSDIAQNHKATFTLPASLSEQQRMGDWIETNEASNINNVATSTYWHNQLLFATTYIDAVNGWTINVNNDNYNSGNGRWINPGSITILEYRHENTVNLYDKTRGQIIASRNAATTGDNVKVSFACVTTTLPQNEVFQPVVTELDSDWQITNLYTQQGDVEAAGLELSNAITSLKPLSVGKKIQFVLPPGSPMWISMDMIPTTTPITTYPVFNPGMQQQLNDGFPYAGIAGSWTYLVQSQLIGWTLNTLNSSYGGAYGGSYKIPTGGSVDMPVRIEYGSDQILRMYDDNNDELIATRNNLVPIGESVFMSVISNGLNVLAPGKIPSQIITDI